MRGGYQIIFLSSGGVKLFLFWLQGGLYIFNLLNVVFQKRLAVAYWRRSAFVLFSPPTVVVNNIKKNHTCV